MEKNKKKKVFMASLVVLALCSALAVSYLAANRDRTTSSKKYTEEEIKKDSKEKEYIIEEQNATYTFRPDGKLIVSGSGSTKSFASVEEAKTWYLEQLYFCYTGAYPNEQEQLLPFRQILDRVTEIEICEGITEIGESSFTPFYHVKYVYAPQTVEKVGNYAFLGTGQYEDEELMLFGFVMEELDYSAASFALSPASLLMETDEEGYYQEELPVRPKEEQGTVPDEELLVAKVYMGEHIEYCLYENGVLYVTGTGATFDFEHYSDMEKYVMEELKLFSRQEAETGWFERVTEIVLEDSVERIGDNSLALYKNVSFVYGGNIKELGHCAFFRMGRDKEEELVWNVDFTNTAYEEDSFLYCRNKPEGLTKAETK